ncbi:MAG TPA: histidine kinase [Solirubrobacteraceae bacterium]|nr:histidine kinase [Solirubrobacteraceae bacterium]
MRRSLALPWALAIVAAALVVLGGVLEFLPGASGDPWWVYGLWICLVLATVAVGLLVAVRRPGHPIGLLLLANALIIAAAGAAESYARYGLLDHPGSLPGARWAALYDQSAWPLLFAAVTAIALVFPDGRLPSPRWRRVAAGATASFALVIVSSMTRPFEGPFAGVRNPLPELPAALGMLGGVALLGVLFSLLAAVTAVRVRFRRASGIERLQLQWLMFSAASIPLALLLGLATGDDAARTASIFVMSGALSAGVAVAILRYRLYEIDRLINRSLVYGLLTLLLAGAYAAITLALGVAASRSSPWETAVATLAVAAAFLPLRTRVQRGVDKRFARARYDALRRIEAFLADLRGGRTAPEEIESVLAQTLGDPRLELHYWLAADERYSDARGNPVGVAPDDGRVRTPVSRGGAPMGVVVHDPALDERPHLLASVIEAAGLAIEIARLRVELRRQLEEVEASRARIVAAGYEERRRIERDLHDGAQQRLVSIGLALRHLQHELPTGSGAADEALDGAVAEITHAIGDLRELARGVRPSLLDEGIGPALRELAQRSSVPVEVRATPERFAGSLEAAAYFIVCEGLTNAVKHAHASRIVVSAGRANGSLVVSVADDGVGGAAAAEGSGLMGLADRVAAQGGTLRLRSAPSAGTTLTVELPCAS